MKPGPAMSIVRTSPWGSSSAATSRSATARGLALSVLASTNARFVATSPWAGSRGRSSSTSDATTGAPSRAAASASAAPIGLSALTCRRSLFSFGALGRLRLGARLRLRRGLGPLLPVLLLLTGPLVVGDVETRALEDKTRPAGDLPLRLPAAHGALLPTLVVHRRKELLEHVPRRALVLVGWHRAST